MALNATYLGSSGWLVKVGDIHVLVDPWLTGTLTFPPGPWLLEGSLTKKLSVPSDIDLILLTQGLADHAHPPTLRLFSRSIPIIGSSSAVKLVKSLGFKNVLKLSPGDETEFGRISIKATAGAHVPNLENGYLVTSEHGSFYLEPHGFLDPAAPFIDLDVVITPVVNLRLPLAGSFIRGKSVLPELINRFNPLNILASTTGGDAEFKGILNGLITFEGSSDIASDFIGNQSLFIDPTPGKTYNLNVRSN